MSASSATSGASSAGCGLGGIGVVAVHHDVVVGVHVAQHLAHDVALALPPLRAYGGPMLARDGTGAVRGVVVVYVHLGIRQGGAEVVHHLGDGHGLVVAGDEHGDARTLRAAAVPKVSFAPSFICLSSCVLRSPRPLAFSKCHANRWGTVAPYGRMQIPRNRKTRPDTATIRACRTKASKRTTDGDRPVSNQS